MQYRYIIDYKNRMIKNIRRDFRTRINEKETLSLGEIFTEH